jgi:hypothetical protein
MGAAAVDRDPERLKARYELAGYIVSNPDRIYFNDSLWHGFQNHALGGEEDPRLTRKEREQLLPAERKLRDEQAAEGECHSLTPATVSNLT